MTGTYYYVYPFGQNADDLAAIPTNAAGDGSVSYYAGWTDPYEYDLIADPTHALPIPRGQMNQLFFDITNNIQQYQQYGTPFWITASQNGSVAFPYPIYARVYYGAQVYENQVAANTATPGTDDTWLLISAAATGVPTGTIIDFAGTVAPAGYFMCDGSQKNRVTYSDLMDVITLTQTGTVTNTMNTVSGLSNALSLMYGVTTLYPGMPLEGTNIPPGTTILNVVDNNNITMSQNATGSGSVSIQFFSWGNGDGSTTFNLPALARKTTIGQGGTKSTDQFGIGSIVGQSGGQEGHVQTTAEMATHNHNITVKGSTPFASPIIDVDSSGNFTTNTNLVQNAGSSNAFNIIQPSAVMNKCIKY